MPLLNYTTKVDVYTTVGEIQSQLVKHGARKIMQEYNDEGGIDSLTFLIDTPLGIRSIRLPSRTDAVAAVLLRQKIKCDRAQAERVAWRILKDWVEAQMAILESEMVTIDEVFLPYMIDGAGNTVYQLYSQQQMMIEGAKK